MIYVEIDGNKYPCEFEVGRTQKGQDVARIKSSDAPISENGIKIFNDDNLMVDLSEYTNLYQSSDTVKEYTKEAEEIIPVECFEMGDIPTNPIQRQISALNARVSDITPYEQTKVGYFGENEKVFYGVPKGNVSVFFDNFTGRYLTSRVEDRFIITFPERLTAQTNITISVQ